MNVVDKTKTNFYVPYIFLENCGAYEIMTKMWWNQRGHKWCHSMAHTRCMLDKQDYTRMDMCKTYCFSMATVICERASMLRYVYIAHLVKIYCNALPFSPVLSR
jgi:hypothetical protein